MKRNLGATTGLIAIFALAVHTFSPNGENHPGGGETKGDSAKSSDKQDDQENAREGPWLATRAFFATPPDPGFTGKDSELAPALAALTNSQQNTTPLRHLLGSDSGVAQGGGCTPEKAYAVVATVADPVHTRQALFFDGQIESVESAAEERSWIFARQWLPWGDPFDGSEHDINVRRQQRRLESEQESMPGILIFRGDRKDPGSCLFILLSPETATGGVDAVSLTAALNIATLLSPKNKIGLLAPSFSGSFSSLARTISAWSTLHTGLLYQSVYGGTVSSADDATAFVHSDRVGQAGIQSFFSGILEEKDYLSGVVELGQKYGIASESIAYLTEAESEYGAGLVGQNEIRYGHSYRFPRDISHLRNAYQHATAGADTHTQNPIPSIELSLDDPNRGEDSIPVFSDKDTPAMQDAGLAAIAEDMRRRDIRLVYIAATNSLDDLFLAQFLRQQCPNIRVVIGGDTDLLFLPAAVQRSLAGTIFLSTYPMFFEGDDALAPYPNFGRYDLPSGTLQGLFNVTQLLLWHLQVDDPTQLPPAQLRGYSSMQPDGKNAPYPGLWLLDLTRFGFAPVDWFPARFAEKWMEESPNPTKYTPAELREPFVSAGWYVTSRLTAILIIAACFIFRFLSRTNKITWPVWAGPGDTDAIRFPFFAGACIFLSLVPWILGLPAAFEWPQAPTGQDWTVSLLGLAFVAPIALLFWIAHQRRHHKRETSRWYKEPLLVGAAPFYLLILTTWWWSCYGGDSASAMFRWRALHFYSSSSPALALWLVANTIVIGFLAEFYRRSDTGKTSPHLDLSGIDGIKAFAGCYRKVNQLTAGTFLWTRMVTCGLVTGVSIMLLWEQLPAFEKTPYNVALEISVFILIWVLACLAYDASLIWFHLSKLLAMVESIPLRGVMARAAKALPQRQVWAFWKSTPQRALGVRMCEALHNRALAAASGVVKSLAATAAGGIAHDAARRLTRHEDTEEKKLADRFLRLTRDRFEGDPDQTERDLYKARVEYEENAAHAAGYLYTNTLWPDWQKSQLDDETGEEKDETLEDGHRFASDFVALHCCNYLTHIVRRTQQLVWNISFLLVLLVVVLNSYDPQGPVSIGRYIAVLFIAIGCVVFYIFAGMERNWVLSQISRTKPGELNLEFWLHLGALGILPLIAVVVHLFPGVATFLYSWVAPGIQSAK